MKPIRGWYRKRTPINVSVAVLISELVQKWFIVSPHDSDAQFLTKALALYSRVLLNVLPSPVVKLRRPADDSSPSQKRRGPKPPRPMSMPPGRSPGGRPPPPNLRRANSPLLKSKNKVYGSVSLEYCACRTGGN